MAISTRAETSDNNMLFAAGLLDRGVLVDINPEVSELFLKDVDVEALFAVNQKEELPEDLDAAIKNVRSSLETLHFGLVRAAIALKKGKKRQPKGRGRKK